MTGVSLPFDWLCGAPHALGDVEEVLAGLMARGVESIELRAVRPDRSADEVARVADLLWDHGFTITVHACPAVCDTAVSDVFAPLTVLFARLRQENVTVTVHPMVGDNVAMLNALADHALANGYPVTLALENNRLLPDKTEGDSASLVLDVVEAVNRPNVGICFDMGHYWYYLRLNRPQEPEHLPEKRFWEHVVHTHIHALNGKKTHFPLHRYDLPLESMLGAVCYGYFGVYNIELDFERFSALADAKESLYASIERLNDVMPTCARLYDDIRQNFDRRLTQVLELLAKPCQGTRVALIHSSSFLFNTNGYRWAMDVAFRNAYRLAKTPHEVAKLFAGIELMIISHGHEDHFEKRTVQALAQTEMKWVIPDFLVEKALAYGVPSERITIAHEGDAVQVGPLTILPFKGRHFRPITGKGTEEYGYHISASEAPSMSFPVDVRDYAAEGLPDLPLVDVCFANVWMGDKNSFAQDYGDFPETYARFMLHFSKKMMVFAHLYECNRKDVDMWRTEHALLLADALTRISPETVTRIPGPGEIFEL